MKRIRSFFFIAAAIMSISIVSINAQTGNDAAVAKQVNKKIRSLTNYGVFDYITYSVNNGNVTLNGKVASLGTKAEAERVIKKVNGVSSVVNNIENLPPSPSDDQIRWQLVRTFSEKGLYRYIAMPNPEVHIIVEMGRVSLEGHVTRKADADALNVFANSIPGTFRVTNNIIVGDTAAE
ncbi:MAG: BON domain-containing protein [Acidobacteria bacterium]|nr:BON domain-containing protein [Acidobacteriota bacterium]